MEKEYLTRQQAAKMLGVTPGTLAVWGSKNSGKALPHYRFGKRVCYLAADVLAYMESCKRGGI